jgi:hypothetical protein
MLLFRLFSKMSIIMIRMNVGAVLCSWVVWSDWKEVVLTRSFAFCDLLNWRIFIAVRLISLLVQTSLEEVRHMYDNSIFVKNAANWRTELKIGSEDEKWI